MKITVTGSKGFIGKNLIRELENQGFTQITFINHLDELELIQSKILDCDFIFHLAGVNRPENERDFYEGNTEFTRKITQCAIETEKKIPIVYASSIQAIRDTPYGKTKKLAEDLLLEYEAQTGSTVYIYRLPNVFGKWSKPFYNSVVSTFCHQISHGMSISIHDENALLELVHIDDVVDTFVDIMKHQPNLKSYFYTITPTIKLTIGELADKLYQYRSNRTTLVMPDLSQKFDRQLYGTYLSYLDQEDFSYSLKKNEDARGWLAEFIKSENMGQMFVSVTKPGVTRGNHWHHTKVEKFLVVSGCGIVRLRHIETNQSVEYDVNEDVLKVIDIPTGYTHSIQNIGISDMVTLFWASEILHPERPDTYYLEV